MNTGGDVTKKNKEIVREFTRVFKNEHNVDGINHLFASDFQHHFKPPVRPGLAGFQDIGRMMNTAFPDVVVTEEDLIAADDRVVERSSAVATHRASLMGEEPTNEKVRWTEMHIYRIRDGKIAQHWVEWAQLELMKQIGGNAGEVLGKFYDAVIKRNLTEARRYLKDDLLFVGLFETYRSAEEYLSALTKLLQITVRLDVKKIIGEGNDAAIFFELETKAPAAATTLVAERHQIKNGKIAYVESAFDGRPFAGMFGGGKR